ncbi:class I SAM-dependent methyltransferase [Pseudomonas sp. MUP55]|uniref:class I SAM-dependent methyltransferase n=1 Tax=Pseudomonas sp. MUP55 TaxID=3087234 RepID=UPI002A5AADD6|nr:MULTISPECIES: class I SAM-dependent methyltransferase [unclassified Pseudomonas]WPN91249.1 class I SAM-dependent methyltransferase [Pseudomonas sp. MUP56]WPN96775.1 class I SAM-dependent methyltransferase [Pseudomonas sp. MUP55]
MTKEQLLALYVHSGKHASYQPLPAFVVKQLGVDVPVNPRWRADHGRLDYLNAHFDFSGQRLLDVGANTGLFTTTLAHTYPDSHCVAWELDQSSADFIRALAAEFNLTNVEVVQQALDYQVAQTIPEHFDTLLLFNVLHHAGVDFDAALVPDKQALNSYIQGFLKALRPASDCLLFQMGFNWGGDTAQPVAGRNALGEKLAYVEAALVDTGWQVEHVGLVLDPQTRQIELFDWAGALDKADVCDRLGREGNLSEFYLRPLFKLV